MATLPEYLSGYRDEWDKDPHDANLAWFRDAKYGLFIHYGLYSQLERGEWVCSGDALLAGNGRHLASLSGTLGIEYLEPSVFTVSHFKPYPEWRGACDDLVLQCRAATQRVIPAGAATIADYYFPQGESTPQRSSPRTGATTTTGCVNSSKESTAARIRTLSSSSICLLQSRRI